MIDIQINFTYFQKKKTTATLIWTSVLYEISYSFLGLYVLQSLSQEIQQSMNMDDSILTSALNFKPYYSHHQHHNLLISL